VFKHELNVEQMCLMNCKEYGVRLSSGSCSSVVFVLFPLHPYLRLYLRKINFNIISSSTN
jgi:hypothetical protein